jgi:hypothetical protein
MAAAGPAGLIVVGGVGVLVSVSDFVHTAQIMKNETGITACTVTRLLVDIAGTVLSLVGIREGVKAWRASGSGLSWTSPRLPVIEETDPKKVRFSQDSISYRFKDGSTIDDLARGLRSGQINPDDVPPIRLVERDGKLYTLDNRRLEAFRRAGVDIPYRMAMPGEIASEAWKFTTQNDGISIRVRGEP